ncbi:hypothetical protein HPULCUR_002782 [Helicostylum pulchrum]|uniref:Uncharacterized protein n=1 Tax=Helicostylum pulchrum TaxID=562976 RepID=A0ABP9XRK4_9FUNG
MVSIEGSVEGWIMVSISSLSCVLGASIVVILGGKKITSSKKFLSASMALGGGVLIFNSFGVLFTMSLTLLIQWCTPHAIHTCDPIAAVQKNSTEREPILQRHDHHHFHNHQQPSLMEYGPIIEEEEDDKNDYFLIGMQTAIAICIHKFPEGLIMFVSNESSSQLGISVAAAMTIHNFIEGFLIALPLYYATGSRLAAFGYASILGGMSQPLGAVLGLLAIRNVEASQEQMLFGIIFGVVSGMMCLISIQ